MNDLLNIFDRIRRKKIIFWSQLLALPKIYLSIMASSKELVQRMVFPSHYLYERKKVKSLISKPYLLELCVKHCGSEVSRSHCQKYICLKWHSAGNLWREWLSGSWPHIYPPNHVHLHWELKAAPTHDVKDIFLLLLKNILFFNIVKIFYENVWMNIYVKKVHIEHGWPDICIHPCAF